MKNLKVRRPVAIVASLAAALAIAAAGLHVVGCSDDVGHSKTVTKTTNDTPTAKTTTTTTHEKTTTLDPN
jgi:hypothetical protein